MNQEQYTSLQLSKALHEAGCDLWTTHFRMSLGEGLGDVLIDIEKNNQTMKNITPYRAYDLIWDISIRYAKEFWGESREQIGEFDYGECAYCIHSMQVFNFLQQGKKQEAEDYILKHSLFFTQNP